MPRPSKACAPVSRWSFETEGGIAFPPTAHPGRTAEIKARCRRIRQNARVLPLTPVSGTFLSRLGDAIENPGLRNRWNSRRPRFGKRAYKARCRRIRQNARVWRLAPVSGTFLSRLTMPSRIRACGTQQPPPRLHFRSFGFRVSLARMRRASWRSWEKLFSPFFRPMARRASSTPMVLTRKRSW